MKCVCVLSGYHNRTVYDVDWFVNPLFNMTWLKFLCHPLAIALRLKLFFTVVLASSHVFQHSVVVFPCTTFFMNALALLAPFSFSLVGCISIPSHLLQSHPIPFHSRHGTARTRYWSFHSHTKSALKKFSNSKHRVQRSVTTTSVIRVLKFHILWIPILFLFFLVSFISGPRWMGWLRLLLGTIVFVYSKR